MKTKTLEDALFDTGAPDEIILLAMVEYCKQYNTISMIPISSDPKYHNSPFMILMTWEYTQQGYIFWKYINQLYQIR